MGNFWDQVGEQNGPKIDPSLGPKSSLPSPYNSPGKNYLTPQQAYTLPGQEGVVDDPLTAIAKLLMNKASKGSTSSASR